MALFLPFRLDFINDPVGDALIEDEFVRRLIQNRLHQINRRKRKRHVLPYAEDWDPFQQWRLAGDAEAGAGYNLLFLVHEAYSLWAQTFRETTGMSKATFNGLVEEARASGLFIDELLVGMLLLRIKLFYEQHAHARHHARLQEQQRSVLLRHHTFFR
jgi:hypothetical protein